MTAEVTYGVVFLLSYLFALYHRFLPNLESKRVYRLILGICTVLLTAETVLHYFLTCTVVYTILLFGPRSRTTGWAVFGFVFGYLLIFRKFYNELGLPAPGPISNAFQLVLSLRLIAYGFTYVEGSGTTRSPSLSVFDFMAYASDLFGICSGPFVSYEAYIDSLSPVVTRRQTPFSEAFACFAEGTIWLGIMALVNTIMPWRLLWDSEFAQEYKGLRYFGYLIITGATFRFRFYGAWKLAEGAFVLAGYDATKRSRNAANNIHPLKIETSTNIRSIMLHWNVSVQRWLTRFVYKEMNAPRLVRQLAVVSTSAFWHGLEFGHYAFFLQLPLYIYVEESLAAVNWPWRKWRNGATVERILSWSLVMPSLDFLGVSFMALSFKRTMVAWQAVYFGQYWAAFVLVLVSSIMKQAGY